MKRALIVFFGVVFVISLVASASATPIVSTVDGNATCPGCDSFPFTLRIEDPSDGTYDGIRIDVTNGTFAWWSDFPVVCIAVKGGPDTSIYDYSGSPVQYDSGLRAPFNSNNRSGFYGLSHIDFCGTKGVPEPATMLLLGSGLIGLGVFGRRKLRKS
ncbi:MAG: PEP-CTERM sorting domain-containing protein [Planctomycetota bacterium]|jgi:hypothetical protein